MALYKLSNIAMDPFLPSHQYLCNGALLLLITGLSTSLAQCGPACVTLLPWALLVGASSCLCPPTLTLSGQ
jgi:hypothetical protein